MEKSDSIKRIAVTGPESSGKTTLAKALADHFNSSLVAEYARSFLERNGSEYSQADLDLIANGQFKGLHPNEKPILISDTDFVVLKVWSEEKYGLASTKINKLLSENHFDLHILCAPDIPWEKDPLRENPNDRHLLYEKYIEVLERYNKDYILVNGNHSERLKKSVAAIESL